MTQTQDPYPAVVPPASGAPGTAALVIGVVIVMVGLVQVWFSAGLNLFIDGLGFEGISAIFAIFGGVTGVLGLAAVVLGLVGLQRTRARRTFAAAGLALGAAQLLTVGLSLMAPTLLLAV